MANLYGISLDYLTENEADLSSDYIVNTINIRLQMLNSEEKLMLLEAMEYYIKNIKDREAIKNKIYEQENAVMVYNISVQITNWIYRYGDVMYVFS